MDRATIAIVEPRLSATAAKADEWLPIKPGHDGALAVAIAHILLTEGLWFKPFVGDFIDGDNLFIAGESVEEEAFAEKYTNGIVKWWNIELKDKTPEWGAPATGLPVEQIRRVAIEYGKAIGNGYRHVTLMQPIIDPVWDYKIDETEITWLIAEKLAERGFDSMLRHFKEYKDPETGKEPTNEKEFALYSLKHATHKLWDPAVYEGGDKFNGWEDFIKTGVWNSAPYPYRKRWGKMKTKTGMFEFYSETLQAALEEHAENHAVTVDDVMEATHYLARGEQAFVPHYEEPYILGDEKEYPFIHVDHKSRLNREGRSANCSWYYDFKDVDPGDEIWDDVAKINPLDAQKLGIESGDKVKLTSPTGSLACTAKLWEGARPGTIAKCYGQGHWAYGRLAAIKFGKKPRGGSSNDIIPAQYEALSGSTAYYGVTRIKIEKI